MKKVSRVFDIGRRIMFEESNISMDERGIEHYPMFAAAFMNALTGKYR